ncbi:hypothetical protein ACFOMD_02680 [Sphingoaurantiacus capsulatus]|uniref:Uncharacterized protein n=1 Tax=Sphingoaurantiacus capsulatus TaxID=1771310 RepID=A0ABV7X8N5_9SPHN
MQMDDDIARESLARTMRWCAVIVLLVSALQMAMAAFVVHSTVPNDAGKLVAAGFFLFSGLAIAVAFGFRKVKQPTWKHWLIVAFFAAPAMADIVFR